MIPVNKKIFIVAAIAVIFCFLIAYLFFFGAFRPKSEGNAVVSVQDTGFEPTEITVRKGDTVVFKNNGTSDHWPASNIHPTHELYKEFDPQDPISPGAEWGFTADKIGNWKFHDHLYPHFTGTVIVREESDAGQGKEGGIGANIRRFFSGSISSPNPFSKDEALKKESGTAMERDINVGSGKEKLKCDSADYGCFKDFLVKITVKHNSTEAVNALDYLFQEDFIHSSIDIHQLAHEIGRQTAETYGLNSQAFLSCPMSSFNGGCHHGFFEYVLGRSDSTTQAANLICKSLGGTYSDKFKFYCYHGVGHGIMMAQAYDLDKSLKICDELSAQRDQEGCWQGVFMENVNAGIKGTAREGIFSHIDPLSPCNNVGYKYRTQCYLNHAGYLMMIFRNSVKDAGSSCLNAPDHSSECVRSLGGLTSNQSWQYAITGQNDFSKNVETALGLCAGLPDQAREDCFIGGLDEIMNNDEMDFSKRAIKFCEDAQWPKENCYRQVGINVARQVAEMSERRTYCEQVDIRYRSSCFGGAGIW